MTDRRTIRVLVVDDSVVVRRLVSDVLSGDPEITVVGTAPNGRIGLDKIPQLNPDLVVLDLEMPELDGLATLERLRRTWPRLPVVMFSSLTRRGAQSTLDALALGASDYVTKPERMGTPAAAAEHVRTQLVTRIKALCSARLSLPRRLATRCMAAPAGSAARAHPVQVLAVAASTGGPNALAEVVSNLPADLGVPVVIVQHMPPMFTALLAERLSSRSGFRVREGVDGEPLRAGDAWVAPGDYHMAVVRAGPGSEPRIALNQGPPENSCRPAADVLFRSAAAAYGSGVLGVVLTGMGQDGLRGCEEVRRCGGTVFVQDEATSVVWGMPGFVASAGLAEKVLPLDRIAPAVAARVHGSAPVAALRAARP